MKTLTTKVKLLTAAVTFSLFSATAVNAETSASLSDKQAIKEARATAMIANTLEAANTTISAEQAISIAQQQVVGSTAMGIKYSNGKMKMGRMGKHGKGKRGNDNNTEKSNNAETKTKTPAYHVGLLDTDGKRYHVSVDSKTGAVLKNKEMKQRKHRQKNSSNTNSTKKPTMKIPTISLSQAMKTAENSIGGKAVSGGFGKMGIKGHGKRGRKHGGMHGHHGKRDSMNGVMQNQQSGYMDKSRLEPSYHIKVVKNNALYFVKVDGSTGKATDTKTLAEMKAERKAKRAERRNKSTTSSH